MLQARLSERCHRPCGTPQDSPHDQDISYWRSEILQAMFWLKQEGFGDEIGTTLLERFLGANAPVGVRQLGRLVDEGYIEPVSDRYRLSAAGAREGELQFVSSFDVFLKPPRCTCSFSGSEV